MNGRAIAWLALLGAVAPVAAWAGEPPALVIEADPGPDDAVASGADEVFEHIEEEEDWQEEYVDGLQWRVPIERAPFAVTVLERREIEASGARNLGELLRGVPGLSVGLGTSAQTLFSSGRAAPLLSPGVDLYLDGRPVRNAFAGSPTFSLPLILADVERVEIIRSATGVVYGTTGLSAVVLVWTRDPAEASGTVVETSISGPLEAYRLTGIQSGSAGGFDLKVAAEHDHIETFRIGDVSPDDGDQQMLRLTAHLYGPLAGGDLEVIGGVAEGSFVTTGLGVEAGFDGGESSALVRHRTGVLDGTLDVEASWSRTDNEARFSSPFIPSFEFVVDTFRGTVQLDTRLGEDHRVLAGLDGVVIRGEIPDQEQALEEIGAFAMDEWEIARSLVTTLGVRFTGLHPAGEAWLPSASVVWSPTRDQSVRLVVARGLSTPAPVDLFDYVPFALPGVEPIPLVALRAPENPRHTEIRSVELGYRGRWDGDRWGVDVDGFFYDLRGIGIDRYRAGFDGDPSTAVITADRMALSLDYRLAGVDVWARARPRRWITLAAAYTYATPVDPPDQRIVELSCDAVTQPLCEQLEPILFEEAFFDHVGKLSLDLDLRRSAPGPWLRPFRGVRVSADVHARSSIPDFDLLNRLVNARIAYEVVEDSLEVALEGWNLTGERSVRVTNDPRVLTLRVRGEW